MAFNFFQKFIQRRAQKRDPIAKRTDGARDVPRRAVPQETSNADVPRNADRPMAMRGKSDHAITATLFPHISEKATSPLYVFRVSQYANKALVKKAIEDRYSVKVSRVHVMNTHGRIRRRGSISGFQPGYKKALVTLQKDYSIKEL